MAFYIRPKNDYESFDLWMQQQFEEFQRTAGLPQDGKEGQILVRGNNGSVVWENFVFTGGGA